MGGGLIGEHVRSHAAPHEFGVKLTDVDAAQLMLRAGREGVSNLRGGIVAWALAAHRPERAASLTVASVPHPRALARSLTRSPQALRNFYGLKLILAVALPLAVLICGRWLPSGALVFASGILIGSA